MLPEITDVLTTSTLTFRVWPQDLDINRHMNNGRYLQIMDLGRYDWLIRTGIWDACQTCKVQPVLAALQIRYRLPLMPFQKYTLETQVLGWEGTRLYIEQRFKRADGVVVAIADLSAALYNVDKQKSEPMFGIFNLVELQVESPPLPAHIIAWQQAEQHLRKVTQ